MAPFLICVIVANDACCTAVAVNCHIVYMSFIEYQTDIVVKNYNRKTTCIIMCDGAEMPLCVFILIKIYKYYFCL